MHDKQQINKHTFAKLIESVFVGVPEYTLETLRDFISVLKPSRSWIKWSGQRSWLCLRTTSSPSALPRADLSHNTFHSFAMPQKVVFRQLSGWVPNLTCLLREQESSHEVHFFASSSETITLTFKTISQLFGRIQRETVSHLVPWVHLGVHEHFNYSAVVEVFVNGPDAHGDPGPVS